MPYKDPSKRKEQAKRWKREHPEYQKHQREYMQQYRQLHKEKYKEADKKCAEEKNRWVKSLLGNKCSHCQYSIIQVLEFHHINPRNGKKDSLIAHLSRKEILPLIQNQELLLLCPNCHREKHLGFW